MQEKVRLIATCPFAMDGDPIEAAVGRFYPEA
jgi:hypothetical protein